MVQAAEHWELALAINPLYSEGWFSLGYCYLKTRNNRRAVQAFTRCTQQQPDNGDAWNNIAALNIQVRHRPLAFVGDLFDVIQTQVHRVDVNKFYT